MENIKKLGERNLIKVGNSIFVSLPANWLRDHVLGPNEKVTLFLNEKTGSLSIVPRGGSFVRP